MLLVDNNNNNNMATVAAAGIGIKAIIPKCPQQLQVRDRPVILETVHLRAVESIIPHRK
jgi:hypothetical protein